MTPARYGAGRSSASCRCSRRRIESCASSSAARSRSARRSASHVARSGTWAARSRSRSAAMAAWCSASLRRSRSKASVGGVARSRRRKRPPAGRSSSATRARCFVGDALRLAPRAACGVELVGEVFGVVADALVKLREFGPAAGRADRWLSSLGGAGWRAWAAVRWRAAVRCRRCGRGRGPRRRGDAWRPRGVRRAFARREFGGLVGGDLGAVELAFGWGVDEEQLGGFSRARERGVGPVAGEVVGVPDDAGPLHGAALDGVRGQRVGVLEVLGHVGGVEACAGRRRRCARGCPSRSGRRR